ncbi:lysylphosphatidylglycerol synthase domain-containing protein [Streptomyces sp. SP18CS02]|uniref:lysylphosphatidylglycerol synthase domain-containing protein n=1 Tax=Streptomyces sp. SP18CS02 TaxID=3002531 RepID=UPI002E780EFD|nr:lysylphosphatidylglycerol synthase domain-containing protein [Streptomyces sp. SP18CS02]MEE1753777.1 lysylphosphatidylglycerol synthase domain-containing protein [Streptomyces sp. SP18CS02]
MNEQRQHTEPAPPPAGTGPPPGAGGPDRMTGQRPGQPPGPAARGRLRTVTGCLLAIAIAVALYWTVRDQDWSSARPLVTGEAVPFLLASCALNVLALVCAMLSWRGILADLGHRLPVGTAARVYFIGMSAKYLPGPFWVVLTQARLAGRAGVSGLTTVAVFLLNIPVILLTGLVVGALAGPGVFGSWGWLLSAPAALLVWVLARPAVVGRAAVAAARLLRRELTSAGSGTDIRAAIGWQLACRLVSGLHLWALALALGAPAGESLTVTVGAFALTTVVSTLIIVLPDGAFVRELLLIGALSQVLPVAAAGAVAIASRAVCLLTELLITAVMMLASARPAAKRLKERARE